MELQMQALSAAMMDSIFNVMEKMFFLSVNVDRVARLDAIKFDPDDTILAARLHFSGQMKGYSTIFVPKKLAAAITANFLGTDKFTLTKDQIIGTVTEIVNMLVGDTFNLFDPLVVLNLTIPKQIAYTEAFDKKGPTTANEITIGILTQEDNMAFQMVIEQ